MEESEENPEMKSAVVEQFCVGRCLCSRGNVDFFSLRSPSNAFMFDSFQIVTINWRQMQNLAGKCCDNSENPAMSFNLLPK